MFPRQTALTTLTLILAMAAPALAVHEAGYSVEVLVNGRPMSEYHARGTTYIEAVENAEYAVRIRNHTGRRIAVALAVDGLNSIDAKTTTAARATKWVLDPWQTITVDGWQTGADTARRFFFTTEDRSYGAWLGRTANLGVIEAVVFREAEPPPQPWSGSRQEEERSRRAPGASSERAAPDRKVPIPDPTPGEGLSDDYAATGIGREVDNPVRRVHFKAESRPAAHLRLRYEYRPQLVRLGVLPDPVADLHRRERASGFEDFEFAPDPWR